MITQEQAVYLLALQKVLKDTHTSEIVLKNERTNLDLMSPEDRKWEFKVQYYSNKRVSFKISIHHLETNTNIGLMRVCYNSGHKNPEIASTRVPDFLKPFAGASLDDSHIHFFVQGYKDLAWALPLKSHDFPAKKITSYDEYMEAVKSFNKAINLISPISILKPIL